MKLRLTCQWLHLSLGSTRLRIMRRPTCIRHGSAAGKAPTDYICVQAALFLQDFTSFDVSPQFRSINGTSSSLNTVFQILLQPEPGTGFQYSWKQMDEPLGQFQLYNINGSVPCCIPVTADLQDQIYADFSNFSGGWQDHVREVEGQILGQCNVTDQTALLSWYAKTYLLRASNGSLGAHLLGVDLTNVTLKPPPPVVDEGEPFYLSIAGCLVGHEHKWMPWGNYNCDVHEAQTRAPSL